MSIPARLQEFLDREHVRYEILPHDETYTASRLAQALRVSGKELAKVVVLKVEDRFVMTVLPASWKLDLNRLREIFDTSHVRLATEQELRELFPDCDVGAMPPFGNLYGISVYVDQSLLEDEEITFHAGTHTEAVKLRYEDFARPVRPVVAEFHAPTTWGMTGS